MLNCVESVVKNSFLETEIILVDNASSDESHKKCKEKFPQIILFENEKNNHIAIWHDETHLNYYVNEILKNKVKYLPTIYHGFGNSLNNKVDFLKKNMSKLDKPLKHVFGNIIKNKYNFNFVN